MSKSDNSSSNLISNSFYLMLDWGMSTVLSLVFWLIVSRTFSVSEYGIVSTSVNTSLVIAAFALLGMNAVVVRMIPVYMKSGSMEKVNGLVKFAMKFALASNFVVAGLIALFSSQLSEVLKLPVDSILAISLLIFGWGFFYMTNGIFQGMQNMRLLFGSNLVGQILKLVLPFVLFGVIAGFMGPLVAFVVSLFVPVIIRTFFLPMGRSSKVSGREMVIGIGLPVLVTSIMWIIFTNIPNIMVNSITGDKTATGIFAIAMTLIVPIVFIPMTLSQALTPINSGLSATANPKKRQGHLISQVVKFTSFLTIPLVALLLVFSSQIILFFSHKVENLPASDLLMFLAPGALLVGIGQILVSSIFALGDIKATRNITVLSVAIFFAIGIYGTSILSSLGMAIGYLLSASVLVLMSYLYLRKYIGLRIDLKPIAKIIVAALVFAAISIPLNAALQSNIMKAGAVLAATLAYLLALGVLKYYTEDDLKIVRHLSSRSRAASKVLRPVESLLRRAIG